MQLPGEQEITLTIEAAAELEQRIANPTATPRRAPEVAALSAAGDRW